MSSGFYRDLPARGDFSNVADPSLYTPVPADWLVIITDVQGSTKAIEEGRYKEVNLAGAASIMAMLNAAGDIAIPYVFGGDGATLLIPASLEPQAMETLARVRHRVRAAFGLGLRVGFVPVSALMEVGASLRVAKFRLSAHLTQAAFEGGALSLAEQWVKKGGGDVRAPEEVPDTEDCLSGLECRWQPVPAKQGEMVSLLVKAKNADIYAQVLAHILALADAAPVTRDRLRLTFSLKRLSSESRIRGGVNAATYLRRIFLLQFVGWLCFKIGLKLGSFDGARYPSEVAENTDIRKFDEMLRMILDLSPSQRAELESFLSKREQAGDLTYGLHSAPSALLTCLVSDYQGNHIHFVDGSDGGYALAAKAMKAKA